MISASTFFILLHTGLQYFQIIQTTMQTFSQKTGSQMHDSQTVKLRRSSKISSALKIRFLQILQNQGTSIKQAANHLKINYSTAKVIAKENQQGLKEKMTTYSDNQEQYFPSRTKKSYLPKKESHQCTYSWVDVDEDRNIFDQRKVSIVQIISTVAWNFMEAGLPQVETKKLEVKVLEK